MRLLFCLAVVCTGVGCRPPDAAPATDAGVAQGSVTDAGSPDAATRDAAVLDASIADAAAAEALDAGGMDGAVCPPGCTGCSDGICEIYDSPDAGAVCPAGASCRIYNVLGDDRVDCSAGVDCHLEVQGRGAVLCGTGACTVQCTFGNCHDVDCSRASSCNILCGQDGCERDVRCGGAHCAIACSQFNACLGGVLTCTAQRCDIDCSGGCPGTEILCGPGDCHLSLAEGLSPTTVDCSSACGCEVDGGVDVQLSCPAACDGGCLTGNGCQHCPAP